MPLLMLLVLAPTLAGLAVTTPIAILWRRNQSLGLSGAVRGAAIAALLVAILGTSLVALSDVLALVLDFPGWLRRLLFHDRRPHFVTPLVFGIIGAIMLLLPRPRPSAGRSADLTPRAAMTFTRRSWLMPGGIAVILVLISTVLAGLASVPDGDGRYTIYRVDAGIGSVGSGIYGWHYSIPTLVLLAVLLALVVLGLRRIARPAWRADQSRDAQARRQRVLVLIALTTGAVLLHLGDIWASLAASAELRGIFPSGQGPVRIGSDFAALAPPLRVGAWLAEASGYLLWFGALLALVLPQRLKPTE